jgi:diphthamide biosynthesis protein 2
VLLTQWTQEFFRPIVTPFELQIALGVVAAWDGRYLLEFEKVLGETALEPGSEDADQNDEPEFSLITGKYRQVKKYGDLKSTSQIGEGEGALVRRNHEGTVAKSMVSAAGQYVLATLIVTYQST